MYYERADSLLGYEILNDSVPGGSRIRFQMAPGDTVKCGQTIAEIDDEIPFQVLHISWNSDSLSAASPTEVKELFDKTVFRKTEDALFDHYEIALHVAEF